jgi:RimJ/RimL family protein N-acetyltransferase
VTETEAPQQPIFCEGRLVRLRPLRTSDMERTIVWRNDSEIRDPQLGYPFPITTAMEERWFAAVLAGERRDRVSLGVEEHGGPLIGLVHLTRIDWIARHAVFGITIGDKERQGKGFGKEATRLMIDYAFSNLNLRRIWLEVPASNKRAIRLYEGLGFEREGTLRAHAYVAGALHDVILFGLLREDGASAASALSKKGR